MALCWILAEMTLHAIGPRPEEQRAVAFETSGGGHAGSSIRVPVLTVLSALKHLSYLSVGPYLSALSIGQTQGDQIICRPCESPFGSGRGRGVLPGWDARIVAAN